MHLYRKIEKQLSQWINSKKGLIVYGARQVGKTYILKDFIGKNFNNYCYINLLENIDAIETLLNTKDSKDFLLRLSSVSDLCCSYAPSFLNPAADRRRTPIRPPIQRL